MCTWPPSFRRQAGLSVSTLVSASRWWMQEIPVRGPHVVSLKADNFYTSKVTQTLVEGNVGPIVYPHIQYVLPKQHSPYLWCYFRCLLPNSLSILKLHSCLSHSWLLYPGKQVCIPACVHNLVNKGMSLCPAAIFSGGIIYPCLWLLSLQLTQPSDPVKTFCPQAGGTLSPCWFELCPDLGLMNPSGLQTLKTREFLSAGRQ